MVKKMNKKEFIAVLAKELNYSEEKCLIIISVLEDHFFLKKKNKDIIIQDLTTKLKIDEEEATNIYNIALEIINNEIKYKLKHPFKSKS